MIINKFLTKFSEEYNDFKTITQLLEFTKKTLPSDGTDKIFIGCVLIILDIGLASREYLISIVKAGKEKIGNTNLLNFYVKRINRNKLVSKYLKKIDKDIDFDKHLNLVLEYLEQFAFDFTKNIKISYDKKIAEFKKRNSQ